MISATLFSDPACPWAYSESPALRVLEWRYDSQLDWRLVLIGLTERASQYEERGYTPLRGALGQVRFRRYGMPFAPNPKDRVSATARACRAVVATQARPSGQRMGRVPRASVRELHDAAAARRRRGAARRAVDGPRDRRRRGRLEPRLARGGRRLQQRPRRDPRGGGLGGRAAGKDRHQRRTGALHRPVDRVPVKRDAARCRWVPARGGVRRAGRQPGPDAGPQAAAARPPSRCCTTSAAASRPRRSRR